MPNTLIGRWEDYFQLAFSYPKTSTTITICSMGIEYIIDVAKPYGERIVGILSRKAGQRSPRLYPRFE